jgi:hypothetical protein
MLSLLKHFSKIVTPLLKLNGYFADISMFLAMAQFPTVTP